MTASLSDPWAVLGLTPSASDDEIKARYRALALENHPDKIPNDAVRRREGEERLKQINNAHDEIKSMKTSYRTATPGPPTDTAPQRPPDEPRRSSRRFRKAYHEYAPRADPPPPPQPMASTPAHHETFSERYHKEEQRAPGEDRVDEPSETLRQSSGHHSAQAADAAQRHEDERRRYEKRKKERETMEHYPTDMAFSTPYSRRRADELRGPEEEQERRARSISRSPSVRSSRSEKEDEDEEGNALFDGWKEELDDL